MTKKIKQVTDSIKSKLSFDGYKVNTEVNNYIKTEKNTEEEKMKCTFYLPKLAQEDFETIYYTLSLKRKKISRSGLMTMAIGFLKSHFQEDLNER